MPNIFLCVIVFVCVGELSHAAPANSEELLSRQKRQYGFDYQEAEQRYEEEMQNAYQEAEQQYEQEVQDEYRREEEMYQQEQQAQADAYREEQERYQQEQQAQADAYREEQERYQQEEMAREAAAGYRYGRSTRQRRSVVHNQMMLPAIPVQYQQIYPTQSVLPTTRNYQPPVARPDTYVSANIAQPFTPVQQPYQAPYPTSLPVPIKEFTCLDLLDMIFRILLQDRIASLEAELITMYDDQDYGNDGMSSKTFGAVEFTYDSQDPPMTTDSVLTSPASSTDAV